eukprot:gene32841-40538_t
MRIGTHVEYATGIAESGFGTVIDFDNDTEIVTVMDDDDGSTWRGPLDHATPTGLQQDVDCRKIKQATR